MMESNAQAACGPRHAPGKERRAHRWGKMKGKIGFHGGEVEIARPRLRGFDGKEQAFPSSEGALREDWLVRWAMNQMLINVSMRMFNRSVRLPEGNVRRSPFARQGPLHRMSMLKPRRLRSLSTGATRFAPFNIMDIP
jgi:hypothetical protein